MLFGDSPPPGLVGIAKLAAESEVLEAKRAVEYFEIGCRTLLNRTRPGMPFAWSLNPYRGCEFGCRYCYARYTHEFMELREATTSKTGSTRNRTSRAILRRELKRSTAGRYCHRHGDRSLSARRAALRSHAGDSRSLRRAQGARDRDHHQIGSGEAGYPAAEGDCGTNQSA